MKEVNEHNELMAWYNSTIEQIKYQKSLAWKTTILYVGFVFLLVANRNILEQISWFNRDVAAVLFFLILAFFVIVVYVLHRVCFGSFVELRLRRKELYEDIYDRFESEIIRERKLKKRNEEFSDFLSTEEARYKHCLELIWGILSIIFFIFVVYWW